MKKAIILFISLFLFSCAAGPVYVAKTETESVKTSYQDKQLQVLHDRNVDLLSQIYGRYNRSRVDIYPEGIGFTLLMGPRQEKYPYLMVNVRPKEVYFDMNSSKSNERFSLVLQSYLEKYMNFLQSSDLDRDDVKGLAFGVYWPVRDYSLCTSNGGFIEYINIYLSKTDAQEILDRRRGFRDVLDKSEIITSLDLKPAISVKPVF
jgi:hypothetical protein